MNNCSQAVEMLNAAASIDPENKKMIKIIVDIRDYFVRELVLRLERDIAIDFPDKYSEAEKLIRSNQLVKVDKLVEEIYSEEPKTGRAIYIKALALYFAGSLNESLKLFKSSIELDGTLENAKKMKSKAKTLSALVEKSAEEMNAVKYEAAIETLTAALHVDKDNLVINQAAHFQRALANFNLGHFESAFEDYKKFESMKKLVGNVLKDIEVGESKNEIQKNLEDEVVPKVVSEANVDDEDKLEKIPEKIVEENEETKTEVSEENHKDPLAVETKSEFQLGDLSL